MFKNVVLILSTSACVVGILEINGKNSIFSKLSFLTILKVVGTDKTSLIPLMILMDLLKWNQSLNLLSVKKSLS